MNFDRFGDHSQTKVISTTGSYQQLVRIPVLRRKGVSVSMSYTGGPQTKIRLVGFTNFEDADSEKVELAVSDGTDEDFATASDLIVASYPAEPGATAASTTMLFSLGNLNLAEIAIEVWVTGSATYTIQVHENVEKANA
jgi:hypothetical protein